MRDRANAEIPDRKWLDHQGRGTEDRSTDRCGDWCFYHTFSLIFITYGDSYFLLFRVLCVAEKGGMDMAEKKIDGSLALNRPGRQILEIKAEKQKRQVKLRVAAYVRVSSSSEDQLNSFAAQQRHYSQLIASQEDQELVGIYADEGITGTSMEKREELLRLLTDCRRGLIDRVLVKSISRFARNTKECLMAVRELKALNVSVYFEEQHIDTAVATGETMTTMFASIAQAESESISQNMRWSYQHRMEMGTYKPSVLPYGYTFEKGEIVIAPEEMPIVKRVFVEYLSGKNVEEIAADLCRDGIHSRSGTPAWGDTTIRYMLRNEKYMGDSLWHKYYTTTTLPYKTVLNHGEVQAFYACKTHEGIISAEMYEKANALLDSRAREMGGSNQAPLSACRKKIFCGNCLSVFKRRINRGNACWVCNTHEKRPSNCTITAVRETEIQKAFLRLFHKLKCEDERVLREMLQTLERIRERQYLWSPDMIDLNHQIAELLSQNHTLASLKRQGLVDPDIFISQSNALAEQLRSLRLQKERMMASDEDDPIEQTRSLIEVLENGPAFLDAFDEELFSELIDRIIVDSNEQLRFCLKNGLELKERIERTKR